MILYLDLNDKQKKSLRKYREFNDILPQNVKNNIDNYRIINISDARNLHCKNEKATLIVTNPPYVTSYEYADLHQLPLLWLGFLGDLSVFRKKIIGSTSRQRNSINLKSQLAENIVKNLGKTKVAKEVEYYFADMLESFLEMKRVLKKNGKAAIVIGNTKLRGIEILNAEVFKQQFENIDLKTHNIIHREISSKMLPSTRNAQNGSFVKITNTQQTLIYPTEYILIMEKI